MMYRLWAKLEIMLDERKAVAVTSAGEFAGCWRSLIRDSPPWASARLLMRMCFRREPVTHAARLALGLADSVQDIGSGEMFVHEANLDQLHGVSFSKGCYVGQEVVSRTHHRGTARSRILPVTFYGRSQCMGLT